MYAHRQEYDKAVTAARRSIAIDPNDADGYVAVAGALSMAGEPEEALRMVQAAMRLNPHYPASYLYTLGLAQFTSGNITDAASTFERATMMNSADRWSSRFLLASYGLLGRTEDAARVLKAISETDRLRGYPNWFDPMTVRTSAFWHPFKRAADGERLAQGLRRAGVPE
jgi:tetratricopeptide (TPR) repeat protein